MLTNVCEYDYEDRKEHVFRVPPWIFLLLNLVRGVTNDILIIVTLEMILRLCNNYWYIPIKSLRMLSNYR